jgi:hypothetical protein
MNERLIRRDGIDICTDSFGNQPSHIIDYEFLNALVER